jgi:hypothetical protein
MNALQTSQRTKQSGQSGREVAKLDRLRDWRDKMEHHQEA